MCNHNKPHVKLAQKLQKYRTFFLVTGTGGGGGGGGGKKLSGMKGSSDCSALLFPKENKLSNTHIIQVFQQSCLLFLFCNYRIFHVFQVRICFHIHLLMTENYGVSLRYISWY